MSRGLRRGERSPADYRACPDPGSSRVESDVPAASLLFPGQSRSPVSRSRMFSGNTRRTKTKRSATANTPPLFHAGGAPADRWGKCRTTLGPPEIAVRLRSETSRQGPLREGEDPLRGSLPLAWVPPTGDTTQRKGDTAKGDTAKGDTAKRGYQVSLALVAPPGRGEEHRGVAGRNGDCDGAAPDGYSGRRRAPMTARPVALVTTLASAVLAYVLRGAA
jgi:hypothetical protein